MTQNRQIKSPFLGCFQLVEKNRPLRSDGDVNLGLLGAMSSLMEKPVCQDGMKPTVRDEKLRRQCLGVWGQLHPCPSWLLKIVKCFLKLM